MPEVGEKYHQQGGSFRDIEITAVEGDVVEYKVISPVRSEKSKKSGPLSVVVLKRDYRRIP